MSILEKQEGLIVVKPLLEVDAFGFVDLKSVEVLARKKIGDERVRMATQTCITQLDALDDPNLSGWEMTCNRPVIIGYLSSNI